MSTQKNLGYIIALIGSLVALLAFFAMPYVSVGLLVSVTGVQIFSSVIQTLQSSSSSFSSGNLQAAWLLLIILLPIIAVITAIIAGVQLSKGDRAGKSGATWLIVLSVLILVGLVGIYIYFAANNGSYALGAGFWINLLAMLAVLVGGIFALRIASQVVSQPIPQQPSEPSSEQHWSLSRSSNILLPTPDTRRLLIKWVVALLAPVVLFTLWGGESITNAVISPSTAGGGVPTDALSLVLAAIFTLVFYIVILLLAGYLVAADSGRRSMVELWIEVIVFAMVPLALIIPLGLILGLAVSVVVWLAYFYIRSLVRKMRHYTPPPPLESLKALDAEQRSALVNRAMLGGFWFGLAFGLIALIVDLVYFFSGSLPTILLIWAIVRTILLPIAGYFLGRLAGALALSRTLPAKENGNYGTSNGGNGMDGNRNPLRRRRQLETLSTTRAREEVKDLVPNDLPLRSTGAQRFFLILLIAFVLFYPILDPFLFGSGTDGRLAGFGDAGYYVILALGLNIVVGFAGLLDLGYVAFFAIGSYAWAMVGSTQFGFLTGIHVNPQVWPWFFWPMLLGAAFIAAFFGVILGAPTLRLRGDYLAIVTLGFGEIVPIVFTELDKYTNGVNGIVGVYSPILPGVDWSSATPYYYLILVLIVLTIFANIRLRDSRLGRAWIAIREDEIAAASSGVNLVRTKLFAFAAGAFFSGVAGAFHAAKLGSISPDSFSFGDSVIYLAMVVIGGIGSIPGVIVGALAVYAINVFILANLDSLASDPNNILYGVHNTIASVVPGFTFGNIRNLLFGVILVVIMIFRPEGLIPSARRRRELQHGNDEAVEVGSLDVTPGTAAFESEVHVE